MVGHGVAVAAVRRVLVGAEHVSGCRQAEAAGGAAGEDHRLGAHHQELAGAGVDADRAGNRALPILEQAGRHVAIDDVDAQSPHLAVQHLLDVVPLRHRQHVGAEVVHLAHVVLARAVLLELHPDAVEVLDHRVGAAGVGHHGALVDDAVIGDGDLLHVLLGRGVARHDRVVEPVHAHADGAGALDVGLLEQHHAQGRVGLLRADRRHRPSGAATDHEDIGFDRLGSGIAHAAAPWALQGR